MARKKAKKATKKSSKKASRKTAATRTSRKASSRKTKKTAKDSARKKAAPRKAASRKMTRKSTRNVAGEGSYTASRNFRGEQENFVKKNKGRIPGMGKEAEAALEGPEGAVLKQAEDTARDRGEGMDRDAAE